MFASQQFLRTFLRRDHSSPTCLRKAAVLILLCRYPAIPLYRHIDKVGQKQFRFHGKGLLVVRNRQICVQRFLNRRFYLSARLLVLVSVNHHQLGFLFGQLLEQVLGGQLDLLFLVLRQLFTGNQQIENLQFFFRQSFCL